MSEVPSFLKRKHAESVIRMRVNRRNRHRQAAATCPTGFLRDTVRDAATRSPVLRAPI